MIPWILLVLLITALKVQGKDSQDKRGATSFTHVYQGGHPGILVPVPIGPVHGTVVPVHGTGRYYNHNPYNHNPYNYNPYYNHKTITVTKEVPVPVPHPYPVTVEKHIAFPVRVPVAVPVDRPVPVHVPKPYPVHIENPVPYPVKVPVKVPVAHPVPVPVPTPVAVPVYVKTNPIHFYGGHHGYEPFLDYHDPAFKRESGEKSKESENTSEQKG